MHRPQHADLLSPATNRQRHCAAPEGFAPLKPPASPAHPRRSSRPLAIWRGFKRLTQIGLPRRFVIVQFPNAPLIVAFVAGEIGKHSHGSTHADASSVAYLALGIWAYLELVDGVNWFRRLLGLTYAISTTVHLALALQ
jgi:hypothetical protein